MKLHWPAPERNKGPILDVLQRVLPERGRLLEVGSGSGQHAVFFAQALAGWTYQPSDVDPANLASIEAYRAEAQLANLQPARRLDVRDADWQLPLAELDAIYSANMIHISPWECCEGLLRGAARHLRAQGKLVLYGPFRIDGQHTSESNREFDASLRERDARWGVRDLEVVASLAEQLNFVLRERVAMPANNQCIHFDRL